MNTRCLITLECRPLKSLCRYEAIWCYNGGHDFGGGVGAILKRHYTSPEKVNALISMGDLLRLERNRVHPLRPLNNSSHRSNARIFHSHEDLLAFALRSGADYIYRFDGQRWQTLDVRKNGPQLRSHPLIRPR